MLRAHNSIDWALMSQTCSNDLDLDNPDTFEVALAAVGAAVQGKIRLPTKYHEAVNDAE